MFQSVNKWLYNNNVERFSSLISLLEAQHPKGIAFEFFNKNRINRISFESLLKEIKNYSLPREECIGLFLTNTFSELVTFFALVGKRQIVILDPNEDPNLLIKKIKKTHISKLLGDYDEMDELIPHLEKAHKIEKTNILFFTSGTTDEAKAVMLTEHNLCSATYNGGSLLPLTKEDKLLSVLPFSHIFGLVCSLLWPLSFGATVCLSGGIRSIFTDFNLFKPTVTSLVPEMAKFLVFNNIFNPQLKLILIGAGSCDDMTLKAIKDKGIRLSYGYGLTETSSGIALSLGDNPRAMTICPDYKVEIASDNEIIVYSDHTLMEGYYEDEESTKKVLDNNRLATGDLGKIIDGYLFITGRKKEILVFSDGSKLYIPEYENKLMSYLGDGNDFTILQNKKGQIILYINKPQNVEKMVDEFNKTQTRSHQIEKIVYSKTPLPRGKTGKIKKYLINLEE